MFEMGFANGSPGSSQVSLAKRFPANDIQNAAHGRTGAHLAAQTGYSMIASGTGKPKHVIRASLG